jgi:large subunit ribosomal protein L21
MAETKITKKPAPKAPAKAKIEPSKAAKPKVVKDTVPANNGAFAVIETGGKQYRVTVGDTIKIEKVNSKMKEGDTIIFDKVLLIDNGTDSTDIGTPYIAGAKVSSKLIEIGRNAKVIVIKYKQKSRYFKKNGHRQPFFKVRIEKIG